MKLKSMRLKNWRSYKDQTFDLPRLAIVRGENAAGKSSIQLAVEWAITGKCSLTDARGAGVDELIRIGEKEMGVLLEFAGGAKLSRTRNRAGGSLVIGDGKSNLTGKNAEAWIEKNLGALPVLSACLNASRFIEMSEKEQASLLVGALASQAVEIPVEIQNISGDAGRSLPATISSAAEVDHFYKLWFDSRSQVNRDIKALGEITAPNIPSDAPPLADIRAKIALLQKERDGLFSKHARLHSDAAAKRREYEKAQQDLVELGKNILTTEELKALEHCERDRARAVEVDRDIGELQRVINQNRQTVAQLNTPKPTSCPTCKRPLDVEDRSAQIAQLTKDIELGNGLLAEKQAARLKLGDPAVAVQRLEAHRKAQIDCSKAERIVTAGSPPVPDTTKLDTDIATLDGRIAEGNEKADEVSKLEGTREQYQKQVTQKAKLEQEKGALEKLVSYFGPSGDLKAKLIGGRLPGFIERMNEVLARFGFQCQFSLDPYDLQVGNLNAGEKHWARSLKQLSESEAYRFGIAFQIALAEATGANFAIIDRSDMLTADARRELAGALLESGLEQAIVLCTSTDPLPAKAPEGVKFFQLVCEGGITTIVNSEAAHA